MFPTSFMWSSSLLTVILVAASCAAGCRVDNPLYGVGAALGGMSSGGKGGNGGAANGGRGGGGGTGGSSGAAGGIDAQESVLNDEDAASQADVTGLVDLSRGPAEEDSLPPVSFDARDGAVTDSVTEVPAPLPSLLGYWQFEDGDGTTMAADSSTYKHNGTVEGLDVRSRSAPGNTGLALKMALDGDDDSAGVRIVASRAIDNLRAYTVAAWFMRVGYVGSGLRSLISRQLGDGGDELFNLAVTGADLVANGPRSDTGVSAPARAQMVVPMGTWVHGAATYDGRTLRIFVNGNEFASSTYEGRQRTSSNPMYIGTNRNGTYNDPFEGLIDDVVLYSRALSTAELRSLAGGASPFGFN